VNFNEDVFIQSEIGHDLCRSATRQR